MSALSVQPTFPIFTDIDGQPLDNGYIWIGIANTAPIGNPINVYWDAALTIVAAQPIRTIGGYPANNGTPARLYVNSDYSIQVQNKNGSVLYSAPAATERIASSLITYTPGPNSLLTATTVQAALDQVSDDEDGSSYVGFLQAGTNAVPRTAQSKLREVVSVLDFGAVGDAAGDGSSGTDDTVAIQNAINAVKARIDAGEIEGGSILLPSGNYLIKGTINLYPHIYFRGEDNSVKMITASSGTSLTDVGGGVFPVVYYASSVAFGEISNIKIFDFSGTATHILYYASQIDGEAYRLNNFLLLGGTVASISCEGCTYFNVSNFQGGQSGGCYFELRNPQGDHVLNIERANVDSCRKGFVVNGSTGATTGAMVNITNSRYEHNYDTVTAISNTAASGGNTSITSSAHKFVAGDVNSYVRVTGTTHLAPGFYKLVSITDGNTIVVAATYPGSADTSGSVSLAQDIVTVNTSETTVDYRPYVNIHNLHLSVSGASSSALGYNSIVRMNENFICRGSIEGVVFGTAGATPNFMVYVQNNSAKNVAWSNELHLANFFLLNDGTPGAVFTGVYEEGTFTPIIEGTGPVGVATYTTQIGRYTRIGNTVTFWIELTWSAFTGGAGIRLKGFPYAPVNASVLSPFALSLDNYSLTAGYVPVGLMHPTLNSAYIFQSPVGGGATIEVPIDTAATLRATGTYKCA